MSLCGEQDSNVRNLVGSRYVVQRGCTYDKVEYRTAVLPGCSAAADPVFTYPAALSCHCGACRTDSDECAHRASMDRTGCTKPVRGLYPYSDWRDYMIPSWFYVLISAFWPNSALCLRAKTREWKSQKVIINIIQLYSLWQCVVCTLLYLLVL